MSTLKLNTLLERKQTLDKELEQLVNSRSLLKSQAERLKLIPEAVRITGEISKTEREIKELTDSNLK